MAALPRWRIAFFTTPWHGYQRKELEQQMAEGAKYGVCTFGTRPPVDIKMLNEKIRRETKSFKIYSIYKPDFSSTPVTGKFYARHDQLEAKSEEEKEKEESFLNKIGNARARGPHSKYPRAATENQRYGWVFRPLLPSNCNDRRFHHPIIESEHTKSGVRIMMMKMK